MGQKACKTRRAAAKRVKVTGSGRLKCRKAFRSHILTKKTTKRKRHLRGLETLDPADVKAVRRMLNGIKA